MKYCKLFNIFRKPYHLNVDIKFLPSQGYFYPKNIKITLYRGSSEDYNYFTKNIENSNFFGIIETIKIILKRRIDLKPSNFNFDNIKAIDIFYLFLEFIKLTTGHKIFFSSVEFCSDNFMYFDFEKFTDNYNKKSREYIFNGWKFSLPSIGIETSLNRFSYDITIKGDLKKFQNSNYNLIYFLGHVSTLDYDQMINIVYTMDDLSKEDEEYINSIVDMFSNVGIYLLIMEGKDPVKISPDMISGIWTK